ncbi:MAG: class I SAM-dependent rRNA methyltransferase [Bacteroidaceae bacterium]|nr:class I SAM-dependent rRNA methyltransferase [Bacteroidaceae bacterium]
MNTITLRKGKDQSLRRFHPWVFSGAIARNDNDISEGELVRVVNAEGEFMGIGHYQIGSIAVRMLTFCDETIDGDFWMRRLTAAYSMRKSLGVIRPNDNDMYRLVHGEGDQLPGLVIDIYGPAAVMQAHSVGMHRQRMEIAEALHTLMPELQGIYYKSDTTLPYKAGLSDESGFLLGTPMELIAKENGLSFHIDWLKGQKTGFFLDQRDNRSLIEQYAKGRRVLNMFCYTGGFSVYALRGGAEMVHSVDSSERAVEVTDRNVALNFPDCKCHQSFATDAFKFLNCVGESEAAMVNDYDLIVLDPPAFAKHRDALHNALKGYTRLNAKAMQKIKPGGILFTFSCSQAVNKDQFRLAVFTAAAQSHRFVRILHQLHQPADHPINIYHPEGEYLKGLVLQIE